MGGAGGAERELAPVQAQVAGLRATDGLRARHVGEAVETSEREKGCPYSGGIHARGYGVN
jgi:hypothetical protein